MKTLSMMDDKSDEKGKKLAELPQETSSIHGSSIIKSNVVSTRKGEERCHRSLDVKKNLIMTDDIGGEKVQKSAELPHKTSSIPCNEVKKVDMNKCQASSTSNANLSINEEVGNLDMLGRMASVGENDEMSTSNSVVEDQLNWSRTDLMKTLRSWSARSLNYWNVEDEESTDINNRSQLMEESDFDTSQSSMWSRTGLLTTLQSLSARSLMSNSSN